MAIETASVWPVNSLGEIVLELGTGNATVAGFLSQDHIPSNPLTNKIPVILPDLQGLTLADLLAGFVAGAGTVASTDTILQAFNKLAGNGLIDAAAIALKATSASPTLTGITDTEARQVQIREVTAAGAITMNATDDIILVNKTVGAATTVNLTAGTPGRRVTVKDKKGDSSSNSITVTPNGAETIDGSSTDVMNIDKQSVTLVFNGTDWSKI